MMLERKRPSPRKTYGMTLVLVALMAMVLFLSTRIARNGQPQKEIPSLVSMSTGGGNGRQFDEKTKEEMKRPFAGFWQSETRPCGADQRVEVKDRLEIKENGIIWQVKRYRIFLPNDSIVGFFHVTNAYILPFGRATPDTNRIVCDARIIRQIMIFGSDTCYGPSQQDCVWELERDRDSLKFEDDAYGPYTSSVLDTFFPRNMISYVDSIRIPECPPNTSFSSFARSQLTAAFDKNDAAGRSSDVASNLMKLYYEPLFVAPMAKRLMSRGTEVPAVVEATLRIQDGAVTKASVGVHGALRDSLVAEMRTWKFPRGLPPEELRSSIVLR